MTTRVTSNGIQDGSVTGAKLADNAITSSKISDNSVSTAKITDSAVTSAKIADNAVSAAKIPNSSITTAKLASTTGTGSSVVLGNAPTIASAVLTGSSSLDNYNLLAQTVTVSGTVTLNVSSANYFQGAATGNSTFVFSNPAVAGRTSDFILELTNGGAFTITWPTSVKWPGGIAPTLTASGVDLLAFITDDGGVNWRGVLAQKDSK